MGTYSEKVDADTLFNRLLPETILEGDWVKVYQQHGFTMARKFIASDALLLRVQYEICLSLAELHETMRPEVFFDSRRPVWDSAFVECGVERVFTPGDAAIWYRPVFGSKSSTLGISCAAVVGVAQAVVSAAPENALSLRWTVRREFPAADEFALAAAPFCPKTGALQEENGVQRAMAIGFRRHRDDPGMTAATEVRLLRRVPDWSLEHMAGFHLQRWSWCERYKISTVYRDIASGRSAYIVVCIRKLTRGPPLLPRQVAASDTGTDKGSLSASDWEPVRASSTCAWYLQTFFNRIGVAVDVHDMLDGQMLVYYQAALRRGDWDHARAVLDKGPWRELGAAYRKLHGGTNAPKLAICWPKFRGKFAAESRSPAHFSADNLSVCKADVPPVIGTFVHYRDPPGLTLPRRNSEPELIDTLCK